MKDIRSYSKISDRLAVLLCDRAQRDPAASICCHDAIRELEPPFASGNELEDGIKAWLIHRGTPHGYGPNSRSYVYPVGGDRAVTVDMFQHAECTATMWRGEYGLERKELLRFLIRWYRNKGL